MLKAFIPAVGAALLCASAALPAQDAPAAKGRRFDCSATQDPQACEERRKKLVEARDKARAACADKKGDEHADCMEQQFCAQAKDPAKCEARIKSRIEKRKAQKQSK